VLKLKKNNSGAKSLTFCHLILYTIPVRSPTPDAVHPLQLIASLNNTFWDIFVPLLFIRT